MTKPWQETLVEGYTTEEQITAMQAEIDSLKKDVLFENDTHIKCFADNQRLYAEVDALKAEAVAIKDARHLEGSSYHNKIMNLEMELAAKRRELETVITQSNTSEVIDANKAFLTEVYNRLLNDFDQNPTSEFMQKLQVIIS